MDNFTTFIGKTHPDPDSLLLPNFDQLVKLGEDYLQSTIMKYIVDDALKYFSIAPDILHYLKNNSEEAALGYMGSFLTSNNAAMHLRNHLNLWDNNSVYHRFFKEKMLIEHPDDMSAVIIKEMCKRLKHDKV